MQSPADFYDTWRYYWCWQDIESTTFWKRYGRHPDQYPD